VQQTDFRIGSKGSGWLIDSFVQQGLQFEASGGTLRRHTRDNILVAGGSVSLPVGSLMPGYQWQKIKENLATLISLQVFRACS
jgi:hypothetical protein